MENSLAIQLLDALKQNPLVPLFYENQLDVCKNIINACYKGGVRVVEFTNRGENALEVFKDLLTWSRVQCPDLILGIGTIKTKQDAEKFIEAGTKFVVAPVLDLKVGAYCVEQNIPWIPGCGTLSEMYQAYENKATIVKLFPVVGFGGAAYVKSVLAPCPELKIMPSGGVKATKKDFDEYLNAGAFCVGVGSSLFHKNMHGSYDFEAITQTCKTLLS